MPKPVILITSATGRIGKALVALLSQQNNLRIRAGYFSESNAALSADLGADEVVRLELNDSGETGPDELWQGNLWEIKEKMQ